MSVNVSNAYKYFGGEEGGGGELQPEDFHELKMNGGNVTRTYDVFHGLEVTFGSQFITKNGNLLGEYNPLVGNAAIDLPTDASDDTSTFTKANGDTSTMVSGGKLSALFTAISSFFASVLSALNNFKTKQTAVADPTADGNGLSFIDSISQNANGEITPHKKTVQDGSTVRKGVVQLQDSIGSTESATDKAVTPHAVREAISTAVSSTYHAAGTKTVAQLTSSLLVAGNEGNVYNITDSGTTTSDFVDGAGHPINAGGNVGVCDVGGGVYKFDLLSGFVDLSDCLTKTGDASNTTSTFTKNASDTSSMTSGSKLSAIFTAISSFFASLKALAFKDKASYNDLSSGVQSSLDKADSALQSHQPVTDNNPTLAWGTTSKVGKVGSTDLQVTMPANPAQNLPASVITSGTFDAARIPASLPDTGVEYLLPLVHFNASNITSSTQYALIAQKRYSGNDTRPGEMFRLFYNDVFIDFKTYGLIRPHSQTAALTVAPLQSFGIGQTDWTDRLHVTWTNDPSAQTIDVNIYFKFNVGENRFVTLYQYNGQAGGDRYNYTWTPYQGIKSQYESSAFGTEATYEWDRIYLYGSAVYASKIGSYGSHPQIGSTATPVYVDSAGQVQPCTPSSMTVGHASALTPSGNAGQVLMSNGSGTDPSWADIASAQTKHSNRITVGAGVVPYSTSTDNFSIGINYDKANSRAFISVTNSTVGRQLYVSLGHSSSLTPVAYHDNPTITATTSEYYLGDLDILCMGTGDDMPVYSFTIAIQVNENFCQYTVYDKMMYHV